ncbi:hypothetical protein TIFTF001_002179 [Ficus carica]|uniref:Glycoside hydrolase family 19 catalytic domain-containing protein n=1 Tax=Ficus carica TaxID=3494 RepID=A0AA88D6R4_FICCA|nr:hypothetical protein TIFTF001_002179 [Ficus carica]
MLKMVNFPGDIAKLRKSALRVTTANQAINGLAFLANDIMAEKNKPSCHDVVIGAWTPTEADVAANQLSGYGVITNLFNGGECGHGLDKRVAKRIGFYERYCGMLGVSTADNLDCYS